MAEHTELKEIVDHEIGKIFSDTGRYDRYLSLLSRMDGLTAYNALAISAQAPYASQLDTAEGWASRGAEVDDSAKPIFVSVATDGQVTMKDGSKGIVYETRTMYDIIDTSADPPDGRGVIPVKAVGLALLEGTKIPVTMSDAIESRDGAYTITHEDNAAVLVSRDATADTATHAIARELVLYELRGEKDRLAAEFIAVSAANVVCEKYDLNFRPIESEMLRQMDKYAPRLKRMILNKVSRQTGELISRMERNIAQLELVGKEQREHKDQNNEKAADIAASDTKIRAKNGKER